MNASLSARGNRTIAGIWARIVQPAGATYSPELARSILEMEFPPEDQEQIALLLGRNQEGTLSPEEQAEIDDYLRVDAFLSVLRSKARLSLNAAGLRPEGP